MIVPVAEIDQLREQGFAQIADAFSPAFVAELAEAYLETMRAGGSPGVAVSEGRFMVSMALRPPFLDPRLFANPRLMPLIHAALGEDCVLNNITTVVSLPGAPDQHIHKDGKLLFDDTTGAALPCHALTVVVPLIDLDAKTGTTALYPGTHRRESSAQASGPPSLPLLKLGGCYLMDYRLSHRGTANTSLKPRPILYVVYSRPWFIDHSNFTDIPPMRVTRSDLDAIPVEHHALLARALLT